MKGPRGTDVACSDVEHVYRMDGEEVVALRDVNISISRSETVALFGPSGSGKSTLTALIAGLRRPTSGQIWVGDDDLTAMSEQQLLRMRGNKIGMVVQNPARSLLPYGTAEDNIVFAQRAVDREQRGELAKPIELLRQLGLDDLAGQRAGRLSGGEQQRLSVAVAMATAPRLLLADEPTSQLDGTSRDMVVELMSRINQEFGTTMVVVTHDAVVADATHRRITLAEGGVVDDGQRFGRHFTAGAGGAHETAR
jgi:ABC-type lipoprotein export system ATPase subunit